MVAPWDFPGTGRRTPERAAADRKAETVFLRLLATSRPAVSTSTQRRPRTMPRRGSRTNSEAKPPSLQGGAQDRHDPLARQRPRPIRGGPAQARSPPARVGRGECTMRPVAYRSHIGEYRSDIFPIPLYNMRPSDPARGRAGRRSAPLARFPLRPPRSTCNMPHPALQQSFGRYLSSSHAALRRLCSALLWACATLRAASARCPSAGCTGASWGLPDLSRCSAARSFSNDVVLMTSGFPKDQAAAPQPSGARAERASASRRKSVQD